MRLIARVDDTHAALPGFTGNAAVDNFFGNCFALIKLNTIDGQTVIVKKSGIPSALYLTFPGAFYNYLQSLNTNTVQLGFICWKSARVKTVDGESN